MTIVASDAKGGYAPPPPPEKNEFARVRVALISTRWNTDIVDALVAGARRQLRRWGVTPRHVAELHAPGAYELPLAAELAARSERYHAIVAVGVVIRGETPHFDYVAGECARGLQDVALRHGMPIGFGVLTVNDAKQAWARAGARGDNKGAEAVAAALEMVRLKAGLRGL